jgi:hypothetical protein
MGSLDIRLYQDCNAMGNAAKISPCFHSTCPEYAILYLLVVLDCNAMGDVGNISSRVPSTRTQSAIVSSLIIHIIPSHQVNVAIDNASFVPSIFCLFSSIDLWNDVCAADNISHAEN